MVADSIVVAADNPVVVVVVGSIVAVGIVAEVVVAVVAGIEEVGAAGTGAAGSSIVAGEVVGLLSQLQSQHLSLAAPFPALPPIAPTEQEETTKWTKI